MKNYDNFLLENNNYVKAIELSEVVKLFKLTPMFETMMKGINLDFDNLIYRNVHPNFHDGYKDYNIIDPSKITRKSAWSLNNIYNLFFSNSENWNEYPKRDNSLICADYDGISERYRHNMYIVVPFERDIAVSPRRDIWISFYKNIVDDLGHFFKKFGNTVENVTILDDNDWEKFKIQLERYDEKRSNNYYNNDFFSENIKQFNDDNKDMVEKWKNNNITTLELLDFIFDPKRNEFKLLDYDGSTKLPNLSEIWLDSKSLLIKEHEFPKFIAECQKVYF